MAEKWPKNAKNGPFLAYFGWVESGLVGDSSFFFRNLVAHIETDPGMYDDPQPSPGTPLKWAEKSKNGHFRPFFSVIWL